MSIMLNIGDILLEAHSSDISKRRSSLELLDQMTEKDPSLLFTTISELLSSSCSEPLRQYSGLFIKSRIVHSWSQILDYSQDQIKSNCLLALASPNPQTLNCAASAISSIASLEVPSGRWLDLFPILLQNCYHSNTQYQLASLTALSYICEDLEKSSFPSMFKNDILTAIVSNLNSKNPVLVSLCFNIFVFSIDLFEENFRSKLERKLILDALFDCFQIDPHKCLQALCEIMHVFPDSFSDELDRVVFVSFTAIQRLDEKACALALEIWNTCADIDEMRINIGESQLGYLRNVCSGLTDLILPKFFHELILDDDWNSSKAAYTILSNMAVICPDVNYAKIHEFLKENFRGDINLDKLKAGLIVLSAVFHGSSNEIYADFYEFFDVCLEALESQKGKNETFALICIGNMCNNGPFKLTSKQLDRTLNIIKSKIYLQDKQLSFALQSLQSLLSRFGSMFDMNEYCNLIRYLLSFTSIKPEVKKDKQLLFLSVLINILSDLPSQYSQVSSIFFSEFFKRYEDSVKSDLLWSIPKLSQIISIIISKLKQNSLSSTDTSQLFKLALSVINKHKIIEESFVLIGSLAQHCGKHFLNNYNHISAILIHCLSRLDCHDILSSALLLTSDLFSALGRNILDSFHLYLPALYTIMEDSKLRMSHKVLAITCFGDIAESVQAGIIVHLNKIFKYIDSAAGVSLSIELENETRESLRPVREAILQFYLGLISGLYECNQHSVLNERIPKLSQYVLMVVDEKFKPDFDIHQNAIWILSDIFKIWKGEYCEKEKFLNYCRNMTTVGGKLADDARMMVGYMNLSC